MWMNYLLALSSKEPCIVTKSCKPSVALHDSEVFQWVPNKGLICKTFLVNVENYFLVNYFTMSHASKKKIGHVKLEYIKKTPILKISDQIWSWRMGSLWTAVVAPGYSACFSDLCVLVTGTVVKEQFCQYIKLNLYTALALNVIVCSSFWYNFVYKLIHGHTEHQISIWGAAFWLAQKSYSVF